MNDALESLPFDKYTKVALNTACEAFDLTVADVRGRDQTQRTVRARHALAYSMREYLKESFPRIGKVIARDHTTVMSSYRRAQVLLGRDRAFQDGVNTIKRAIDIERGWQQQKAQDRGVEASL